MCVVFSSFSSPSSSSVYTHTHTHTFSGTLALAKVRLDSKTFVEFMTKTYGAIHGSTHVQIGGHMSTMHSPQDPLFFSHHAFIDKLWSVWQDCHDAHDNKEKMFTGGVCLFFFFLSLSLSPHTHTHTQRVTEVP